MKLLSIIPILLIVSCTSSTVKTIDHTRFEDSNVYENHSIGLKVNKPSTWKFQFPDDFIHSIYANNKNLDGIPNSTIAIQKNGSPTYLNIEHIKFTNNSPNQSKVESYKKALEQVFYSGFQQQYKSALLLKKPSLIKVSGVEGAIMTVSTARFVGEDKYPLEMVYAFIPSKKRGYVYKVYSNSLSPVDNETTNEIKYIINNLIVYSLKDLIMENK
ncbi:MAG: hypothetical protein ACJASB_002358 [Shewanella psychromarinicola]|jgi:hypothetical protein|uniref:hypothetical protein n=1 Tax=Shewanella psychromarinicola TaxID=2487742 RepID=UPI003EEB0D0E